MTAENMINMVIQTLKAENKVFNDYDLPRDEMLVLKGEGENINEINIYVSITVVDSGSIVVSINCYDLPNFSNCYEKGLRACNQLNDDELVKYYIDDEYDATANATLIFNGYGISNQFSPQQVLCNATMMALSVDDAYAVLERAKWSN